MSATTTTRSGLSSFDSITTGQARSRIFDRPGELIGYLNSKTVRADEQSVREDSHLTRWTGTPNWQAAMKLLLEGWQDGVVEMKGIQEDIERTLLDRIPRPSIYHSQTGSDIDMSAYLTGEPESMLEWDSQPLSEHGVRIIVNGAASGGIDPRTIKARGAALVAFLHALQMLDVPAELWATWATRRNDHKHEVWLRVSRPGFEIDIERVAFILAHPGMLRRIIFGVWEREEPYDFRRMMSFTPNGSFGYPSNPSLHPFGKSDIYLPPMRGWEAEWDTPEAAVTWILEKLNDLGVELEA